MGLTREQKQIDLVLRLARQAGRQEAADFVRDHIGTLQSANEEFATVNDQLRQERNATIEKNTELAELLTKATEAEKLTAKRALRAEQEADELRDKVKTLKEVATFYRAQRDLVNGYLSGVLDQVNAQREAMKPSPAESMPVSLHRSIVSSIVGRGPEVPRDNRPFVNEPFARSYGFSDGESRSRDYRDEPSRDWENF